MRHRPALLGLLLAGAVLAAGCAGTALAGNGAQDQIRDLEARVLELQRRAAMSEVELTRLRGQVAVLQAQLQGQAPGQVSNQGRDQEIDRTPPGQVPFSLGPSGQVPAVRSSSVSAYPPPPRAGSVPRNIPAPSGAPIHQPPSGAVAPVIQAAPSAGAPIEVHDIDVPPAGRKSAPGSPRVATGVPAPTSAPAPLPPVGPPASPPAGSHLSKAAEPVTPAVQAMYDRGYTLYHQGHYLDAEASFQRFLRANPNSELADNAQYWIGECRYSRGDLKGALAAFRETVARFPDGAKVPDALLKAGRSLEGLGDVEGARILYQEVIRRFPDTAVAAVAEERRAKLP